MKCVCLWGRCARLGHHQGAVRKPQLVSKWHFSHLTRISMTDVKSVKESDTTKKAMEPKVEDTRSFEEKQKPLIDKWNSVWGNPKSEKKKEAPPASKPYVPTPIEHYCEGGFGQICPNKATIHVNCDTEEIGRAVQQECRDRSRMPSSA
eukprot:TRINITY_DN9723_c0_g2_i1.p1 TRINITY_DN9723_c0_g2~~TRINITY_DN9723_c0_g2_i1.p1  ORF type:complete len:149 (+),score=16.15 TRINITY_DN9723_c0_g2_i1:122-568(+)